MKQAKLSHRGRFLVLKGGNSSEREISLKTASHVEKSFEKLGLQYESHELNEFSDILSLQVRDFDYAFLALHGGYGEDGTIQAFLEAQGVRYNGANREASAVCISKTLTRAIAAACRVSIPQGTWAALAKVPTFVELAALLGTPFIVKPDAQGCSIGVALVHSESELDLVIEELLKFGGRLLCEEFVKGDEITVSLLNGELLPFLSIAHDHNFFSFDAKFHSPETTRFSAAEIAPSIARKVEQAVYRMSDMLGLKDYARFDFIIKDEQPFLLEVNTLPGLNSHSVFVKACELAGIGYESMIEKIIDSSFAGSP